MTKMVRSGYTVIFKHVINGKLVPVTVFAVDSNHAYAIAVRQLDHIIELNSCDYHTSAIVRLVDLDDIKKHLEGKCNGF